MTRHDSREQAFILLFEQSFAEPETSIEEILEIAQTERQIKISNFTKNIFNGVAEHRDEIDNRIESFSNKWSIQRLSRVAAALLRMATYEMLFCEETPDGVAINEAVELAKQYGGEDDASFINGILGSISRSEG